MKLQISLWVLWGLMNPLFGENFLELSSSELYAECDSAKAKLDWAQLELRSARLNNFHLVKDSGPGIVGLGLGSVALGVSADRFERKHNWNSQYNLCALGLHAFAGAAITAGAGISIIGGGIWGARKVWPPDHKKELDEKQQSVDNAQEYLDRCKAELNTRLKTMDSSR